MNFKYFLFLGREEVMVQINTHEEQKRLFTAIRTLSEDLELRKVLTTFTLTNKIY